MRCGKCKGEHETVMQVRACYRIEERKATENQLGFIAKLEQERDFSPHKGSLTFSEADELIKVLLAMPAPESSGWQDYGSMAGSFTSFTAPAQVKVSTRSCDVPAGHYATTSLTGNNDLDFWRVDRPEEGKWKGYVFVKRVIGGKPDAQVRKAEKYKALQAIADADPEKAAVLYGQTIGQCYMCNRHLTDQLSRELGIGPDCRSKRN